MSKNAPKMVLATCPQLLDALSILHMYQEPYLSDLIDIWKESVPEINIKQKFLVGLQHYDPRNDHITRRHVLPFSLAKWIEEVSAKRGYPYTYQQALNLVKGEEDYGRGQIASNRSTEKKLYTVTN